MLNSLASGRRLALRLLLWQLIAALGVGLVFATLGVHQALAAMAGALCAVAGSALFAARMFSQVSGAGVVLGRFLVGTVLKWMVVIGGMILIMVKYKLPPLAAITGLGVVHAVNLLAFRFKG